MVDDEGRQSHGLVFDEIGYWSEVKLAIVKEYAAAYSKILASQALLKHVYIDGFAGSGIHVARGRGEFIPGSPLNALLIEPPFDEYHLVDLNGDKVDQLQRLPEVRDRGEVHVYRGDCSEILLGEVFRRVRYEDYRRGLCLLEPYGLHLNWEVLATAGRMKTVEFFLNFPIMDMNRNALWRDPEGVSESGKQRMTAFWGDESWRKIGYEEDPQLSLFGEQRIRKVDNDRVATAFQQRLKDVAGFAHVPDPMPMRNTRNAVIYYLFFASQKPVAAKIVQDIFAKDWNRRG